jgi:sugar phosphate isomerase/epimerase
MPKFSFSSIACPDLTLERVATLASEGGYDGVELRTFGHNSTEFACDPVLTSAQKVRRIFKDHGVTVSCLATGVGFDEPVRPALVGRVFGDPDRSVRLAKSAIELAAQIECPFVRVFGFEMVENERYASGLARIVDRLALVVDAARHTGVRVVLENGGTFTTAEDLMHVLDRISDPLLGAGYSVPVALADGEDPIAGMNRLGERMMSVKIRDYTHEAGQAVKFCTPGDGVVPCQRVVRELVERKFAGWTCVEWDRAWLSGLAPPEQVLPVALERMYSWTGSMAGARTPRMARSR